MSRRRVLHVALRIPNGQSILVDGEEVVPRVHEVLAKMADFPSLVRGGKWKATPASRSATSSISASVGLT